MLAYKVDKSQVPPLHQKRIVAFVNHFIINTCSFLNEFATTCESKLIEIDRKIQRLEAGLTIVEAKLASIPEDTFTNKETEITKHVEKAPVEKAPETVVEQSSTSEVLTEPVEIPAFVRACEDYRYKKFFKMLQFGVVPEAIKNKMKLEGLDPNILDNPNMELPDGVRD